MFVVASVIFFFNVSLGALFFFIICVYLFLGR